MLQDKSERWTAALVAAGLIGLFLLLSGCDTFGGAGYGTADPDTDFVKLIAIEGSGSFEGGAGLVEGQVMGTIKTCALVKKGDFPKDAIISIANQAGDGCSGTVGGQDAPMPE